jgi:hypothetical protein
MGSRAPIAPDVALTYGAKRCAIAPYLGYVVLNPVRAPMVPEAGNCPWSSYRATVGQEPAPAWLETDWVLGQFAPERSAAQAGYAAFVRQGIEQPG